MKNLLKNTFLLFVLAFAGSAMSATMTLNAVGDYADTFHTGVASGTFTIVDKIDLNVNASLLVNSTELKNITNFISYQLYSDSSLSTLVAVYDFFITATSGSGNTSFAEFSTGVLAAGDYFLKVVGNSVGQGQFHTQVTATPVPAAIWLFGSALAGLVSFSRRQVKLAA